MTSPPTSRPPEGPLGPGAGDRTEPEAAPVNRSILVGVDDSANARRAVDYVADLLGGRTDVRVHLLHVRPDPDPELDDAPSPAAKVRRIRGRRRREASLLAECRQRLLDRGVAPGRLSTRSLDCYCPSIADCILSEGRRLGCGTIVVGRQGRSRREEFLFGSVSSRLVGHAHGCAVWVVA